MKLHKLVQASLYKEKDERIAVSSIYERMELSPWLIETVNYVAPIAEKFLKDYPEVSSQVYLPHRDLCPRCNHPVCPERRRNQDAQLCIDTSFFRNSLSGGDNH
jgi:hypothetical protein